MSTPVAQGSPDEYWQLHEGNSISRNIAGLSKIVGVWISVKRVMSTRYTGWVFYLERSKYLKKYASYKQMSAIKSF